MKYHGGSMEAIKIEGATLEYKSHNNTIVRAVDNVSLTVNPGEFIALVGHNGSGKSTLAKLLNGLLIPRLGDVKIYGVSTRDKAKIFEIRRNIGMVFQNPDNQMIASIVEDDIAFGPENLGIPREEIIERVDWALTKVGMIEHKKSTPFKMSGGQKQRLAIAGILAIKPSIIVFDESTAMLDPEGRREVLAVAHELNKNENITVILITHYMDEAIEADRVIVMSRGRIVTDGTPTEVFAHKELLEDLHLTLPLPTSIAYDLSKAGLEISGDILTEKQLEEALCKALK